MWPCRQMFLLQGIGVYAYFVEEGNLVQAGATPGFRGRTEAHGLNRLKILK